MGGAQEVRYSGNRRKLNVVGKKRGPFSTHTFSTELLEEPQEGSKQSQRKPGRR